MDDVRNVAGLGRFCDDGRGAGRCSEAGSGDFGGHAACAEGRAAGGDVHRELLYVIDHENGLCVRKFAWVLVVEAVNVGHEKKVVSVNHGSSDGRKCVIITELDLGDGEGVIFVDDGNDAHRQGLGESVGGIDVLRAVGDVVAGEQDLRNWLGHVSEEGVPDGHQPGLTYCC